MEWPDKNRESACRCERAVELVGIMFATRILSTFGVGFELDRDAFRPQVVHVPLSLIDWHSRVVRAVSHQNGRLKIREAGLIAHTLLQQMENNQSRPKLTQSASRSCSNTATFKTRDLADFECCSMSDLFWTIECVPQEDTTI